MLFSEPKIPQFNLELEDEHVFEFVSVLFSEPKIPQFCQDVRKILNAMVSFSALQRAENSSMFDGLEQARADREVSVLFSEPKIPQYR